MKTESRGQDGPFGSCQRLAWDQVPRRSSGGATAWPAQPQNLAATLRAGLRPPVQLLRLPAARCAGSYAGPGGLASWPEREQLRQVRLSNESSSTRSGSEDLLQVCVLPRQLQQHGVVKVLVDGHLHWHGRGHKRNHVKVPVGRHLKEGRGGYGPYARRDCTCTAAAQRLHSGSSSSCAAVAGHSRRPSCPCAAAS